VAYTVKAVSDLAGVSIRTLHHYDAIGLVRPRERSEAGYRLYGRSDLERLQQVLFFKELGFGLGEIKEILDRPDFDRRQALLDHRELLTHRKDRIERLIRAVDRTLEGMEEGNSVEERVWFDGFDAAQYEEEARQRWGHTAAYKESRERAAGYGQADWEAIGAEQTAILREIAALADRKPGDPEVLAAVGRMHRFINERFYACSLEMFRGLGDLAVSDSRFTETYEKLRPGLAAFYATAVAEYCGRSRA
jgi:DNA-binding transcriptional MerR regulator